MWLLDMFFGPRVPTVTPEEAAQLCQEGKAILVDVREQREVMAEPIPGAVHVPLSQLRRSLPDLPQDAVILCICRSGHRSVPAARRFLRAGYSSVYSVKGGVLAWKRKGLPMGAGGK